MSQVRLRVSALCIRDGEVLLIEHKSFAPHDPQLPESYWILPGGAVERGETLDEAVKREMMEETNFINLIKTQVDVNESEIMVAIDWWKNKVIEKRPLMKEDAKALRMIVKRLKKLS